MKSEGRYLPDAVLKLRTAPLGRRGVLASLLIGIGILAARSFSWFRFSRADGGEYQVIAQWQVPAGGEGLIIAIGPNSSPEKLREVGHRLKKRFHRVDIVAVMIFDDANAARQVRRGSRVISETTFQAALVHQRAMYLKSTPRAEDSFTIYKTYPTVDEVIRFDENEFRGAALWS